MDRSSRSGELCAFYPLMQRTRVWCAQPCAEQSWGPQSDTDSVLMKFLTWRGGQRGPSGWEAEECSHRGGCGRGQSQSPEGERAPGKFPWRSVTLDLRPSPRASKHFLLIVSAWGWGEWDRHTVTTPRFCHRRVREATGNTEMDIHTEAVFQQNFIYRKGPQSRSGLGAVW